MKLFGSIREIVDVVFRRNGKEVTIKPNASTTFSTDVTFSLPNNSSGDTLVGEGASQTLYNKKLEAPVLTNSDVGTPGSILLQEASSNGTDKITVQAPASLSANWSLTLPSNDGDTHQLLRTDGSGNTSWVLVSDSNVSASAGIVDTKLATISTAGKVSNSATTATSSNTASAIVARDASGNFSAGTITATLSGNATNVSGTVAIGNGGTGQTTQQAALNALAGATTANRVLRGNGTNISLSQVDLTTDVTGILPATNGGTGLSSLGSGVATFLGTPSSANLASAITDETGSGSLVFGTSPTLSSPQVNSALTIQQIATPSNPSAGFNKIYTKSDGILYKLDSSGNEVAVGSSAGGSGEINAVLNPSAATDTTGWAAGTSHSVAKDSVNSPLSPVVSTCFEVRSSAAIALGSQTSTSGVYDAITMPSGLQNRKLKVEFFYTTPASSAGTWAVAVYQGSTKVALSTDSSQDTILPAGVTGGKFTAYFDTTSSASYSLNLVQRSRTGANTLYITNVIVGPGIQPQGAVVGEWTTWTPTLAATTTNPTTSVASGRYRRVGTNMEVEAAFTITAAGSGTYFVRIPSQFTIDYQATANIPNDYGIGSGSGYLSTNAGATRISLVPGFTTASGSAFTNSAVFYGYNSTVIGSITLAGASSTLFVHFTVPVAEWAGSGTVQLAQNDVEYAWNSTTTTGSDQTDNNYGYGPQGVLIQAYSTSGLSAVNKRVRFQSPIQRGDSIVLEASRDGGNTWVIFEQNAGTGGVYYRNDAGTTAYGYLLNTVDSTRVDVAFFSAPQPGMVWNNDATLRWRVRKTSAGAAVGFGLYQPGVSAGLVSASGLAGRADGNAIPTGYVGDTTPTIASSGNAIFNSTSAQNLVQLTNLPAGVWLLFGAFDLLNSSAIVANGFEASITTTSGTVTSYPDYGSTRIAAPLSSTYNKMAGSLPVLYVNISTPTTYYVTGQLIGYSSGSCAVRAKITAVRIA